MLRKGKIVSSYVSTGSGFNKPVLVHTALKKSKNGKQLLKNFGTKKEAKKYLGW